VRYLYPEPLKVGDTIGLVTPSSPMMAGRLELGISYLERNGYKTKVGRHVHDTNRFMAGFDEDRAQDIMDFFLDPTVKAIMATGGGYSAQRILPFLDYDVIRKNLKWVTGFSDTTSLQLGILSKAGIASCTGFIFGDLEDSPLDSLIEKTLKSCLFGEAYHIEEGIPIIPGIVSGPLIGGNLGSLMALIGTPFQPDFKESILLVEDVWAEPYKIDSMLSHFVRDKKLKQIWK
jgi:muramoyltetrapeptide carboxypeptidase